MSLYGDVMFLSFSFALVYLAIPIHLMMHKTSSTQQCRPGLYATLPFCLFLGLLFWFAFCLVCLVVAFVWSFLFGSFDLIRH